MTAQQEQFCVEMTLVDENGRLPTAHEAYMRAYGCTSRKSALNSATELVKNLAIRARIQELRNQLAAKVQQGSADVLSELWKIATADPNEIVEFQRVCCRCCWGEDFKYQRTEHEWLAEQAAVEAFNAKQTDPKKHKTADPAGGTGFDARFDPNRDCPHCFGEGKGRIVIKDTRYLSPAALALYAGVKETQNGIEIKLHSKTDVLELLAKAFGLLINKTDVTSGGKPLPSTGIVFDLAILKTMTADELRVIRPFLEKLEKLHAPSLPS
jgi:hypothetical protein